MTSKVGRRFFGKTAVSVSAPEKATWAAQDYSKSWTDGGAARAIVDSIAPAIERAIAENAHLGAAEYLSEGEVALQATDKDVLIGLRIWNNEAALIGTVSLRQLIADAFSQARSELGHDQQAQALVSALIQIGQELSRIPSAHNGPPPQATLSPRINRSPL